MRAALAWFLAALVTWLAFEHADRPELKSLALLTPFILYLAVLRSRLHRLEDRLIARESELARLAFDLEAFRSVGSGTLPHQPLDPAGSPSGSYVQARTMAAQEQD